MIERYREGVVSEEIDGITYTSSKFPTTQALALLARTVRVLGETGMQAVVLANLKNLTPDLARMAGGASLQVFAAAERVALGVEHDPALPSDLLARVKASSLRPLGAGGDVKPAFDNHFSGELPHLGKVIAFVLTHNFAGFTLGSHLDGGSPTSEPTEPGAPSS